MSEIKPLKVGSCRNCGHKDAHNVVMLHLKVPAGWSAWGCFECGLPMLGALTILCDACRDKPITYAVRGQAYEDLRIPVSELTEPFEHDLSKHPEMTSAWN